MILSDLIAQLQGQQAAIGDCVVVIQDADTSWLLHIETVQYSPVDDVVVLRGDYGSILRESS